MRGLNRAGRSSKCGAPRFRSRVRSRGGCLPSPPRSGGRGSGTACSSITSKPRTKIPLLVIANSPSKEAALAGLERWTRKHSEVAKLLAVDDVLIDSMRGRSSTWTRVRVNLRHVPEELRPPQETPDPDDDPTREWRASPPGRGRRDSAGWGSRAARARWGEASKEGFSNPETLTVFLRLRPIGLALRALSQGGRGNFQRWPPARMAEWP